MIPSNVTSIGNSALNGCTNLSTIIVDSENTTFDSRNNCNAIIETASNTLILGCNNSIIPNSVTSIGGRAFSGCSGLTSVTIPNSVTSIGDWAFFRCSGLTSVTIPNSVTSIGDYTFSGCSSLTSVTIPNSVTSIGVGEFYDCSCLTSITIPNSVTRIGADAFYNTAWYNNQEGVLYLNNWLIGYKGEISLLETRTLIINEGTVGIADRAIGNFNSYWDNSTYPRHIIIPNSVLYIGKEAFSSYDDAIEGLIDDDGNVIYWNLISPLITSITVNKLEPPIIYEGDNWFRSCNSDGVKVYVPIGSVEKYKNADGWKNLNICSQPVSYSNLCFDWIRENEVEVIGSINGYYSGNIVIPESIIIDGKSYQVTEIGNGAFMNCSGLSSITIPNSVRTIGESAFRGCSGLTNVSVNCKTVGNWFAGLTSIKDITIGNDVTNIESGAFSGCIGLTSVTIPNSVTSIGDLVFSGCSGLTSVTIPNSVTSIGNGTFRGCSGLTSITIPNSVISIGSSVFAYCGLTSVIIPNSVISIGNYAFQNCNKLSSITIPNSVTSIGWNVFNGCTGLETVTFHCSSIGSWFSGLTSIKEVSIGDEVTIIEGSAFSSCSGLTSVAIPNSVTSIGNGAFNNCSGLSSVTIPSSVTSIGSSAFQGCSSLTLVNISSLKEWTSLSFPNVDSNPLYFAHHLYLNGEEVKDMSIPSSVTAIGARAFVGCTGLESVRIPNSVTEIGSGAFSGCDNLLTVNSEITEPYNCSQAFSNNTYRKGTLKVPAGTKDLYIRFDGWREFLKIEEAGSNEPTVNTYVLTYMVDGKAYRIVSVEEGAAITVETAP